MSEEKRSAGIVPLHIYCPQCGDLHIDEGEWATRPHKTHQCQNCFHEWAPRAYVTVGVRLNEHAVGTIGDPKKYIELLAKRARGIV